MTYDLVIIGTGPGGYVCAIRAMQLGIKVAAMMASKTCRGRFWVCKRCQPSR
jgi:pyruvate/2-oxoglutarate dehydrogenase complex dihydrolipoamide dehydrogenase (E3) component